MKLKRELRLEIGTYPIGTPCNIASDEARCDAVREIAADPFWETLCAAVMRTGSWRVIELEDGHLFFDPVDSSRSAVVW